MKKLTTVSVSAALALALAGCAGHPHHAECAEPHHESAESHHGRTEASHHAEHAAAHHGDAGTTGKPAGTEGPAARLVEFPASVGAGEPREMKVLVDEPALKLVTIVLRDGTLLPEHHSEVAVTIQALQGAGTVTTGSERFRIDPTHALVLAPKVPHAVQPDEGADLVLLVHHLGRGGEHHH